MLVGYLGAVLGDPHLAEDLTQQTLQTADRIFDRFEPDGNFGVSLRGIAGRRKPLKSLSITSEHFIAGGLMHLDRLKGLEERSVSSPTLRKNSQ